MAVARTVHSSVGKRYGFVDDDVILAGYLQDGRSGTPSRPRGPADISPKTDPSYARVNYLRSTIEIEIVFSFV